MNSFHCPDCNKLLLRYKFDGERIEIQIMCRECKRQRRPALKTLVAPSPFTGSYDIPASFSA